MPLRGRLLTALRCQPPVPVTESPTRIKSLYAYWRVRMMYGSVGGYAMFYFVRKNMSMATKSICDEFHFTNSQWGTVLGVSTIVYAFSKFASGVIGDRANPRYLLGLGLLLAAVVNLFFGFAASLLAFGVLWALNNLFQGTGVPPCIRLLTHWFSPKEIGRAWGIWNSSHQIGGAVIVLVGGYLIAHYGWRSTFWVPGLFCIVGAFWVMNRLRDSPESLGQPSVEAFKGAARPKETAHLPLAQIFREHILRNPWVWVVSIANFFVYVVRSGILDWAPKYLMEAKGLGIEQTSYAVSAFEAAGIFGAFGAGWLSDKVFKGRRGPVSVGYMVLLTGFLWALFSAPKGHSGTMTFLFTALGFLVYGPQLLCAVAAADFATKAASSSAVGLTGLFGYLGASFCSFATGYLVDHFGWDGAIWLYVGSAVAGGLLLVSTWNRKAAVVVDEAL